MSPLFYFYEIFILKQPMIPKIIHITVKDKPNQTQEIIINKWISLNPEFDVRVYSDSDNDEILNFLDQKYKSVYNKIEKKICKIDFIRLIYLYEFGGVYIDSDVLPLKSIEPLLNVSEVLLFKENQKNGANFNTDFIISNAIMFSEKNNPFIKKLIDSVISNSDYIKNNIQDTDILNLTGPLLLNKVYSTLEDKSKITLLDDKYFSPMNYYDLKKGFISEDIQWSFGVHLYEGSWWQNEYKLNDLLLFSIENIHQQKINELNIPLISCLCITKNEPKLLKISIDCFKKQIYPNKELIVLYENNNSFIDDIKKSYQDDNIKFFEVESDPKKTLGELRNISISLSNGEYISQWDDDDWYSPVRLWEQFYYMKKNNKNGSILKKWLVYDERNNLLYERERTDLIGWEGSLLFKKSEIKSFYENLPKGEDTGFVKNIENQIQPIYYPELYIYRVHYNNTWDYNKLKIDIIDHGKIYSDQSLISHLKSKKKINKVLCFTTSYNRLKMLRSCISDIKNQTFNNTYHTINITNNNLNKELTLKIFDDLLSENTFINFNINDNQHINHIKAITSVNNLDDYDIFIKIDDDDIYKKNYVKNIVDYFEKAEVDIISSKVILQLNGNTLIKVNQHDLGGNPEGCNFKIPATFAFNRKALNLILKINDNYGFEDNMWRDMWCGKCNIGEIDNTNEFIWHIHGKNISTSDFLKS